MIGLLEVISLCMTSVVEVLCVKGEKATFYAFLSRREV